MLVIPAIDLKDGRCVRLRQGDMRQETVYSEDPRGLALQWQRQGAQLLHVVDLNGAVEGQPRNADHIADILDAVSIPVQIGGGIRTIETARHYLLNGAARVVMGTAALHDRAVLRQACEEFPGRIVLGLDAKGGSVAVKGWTSVSEVSASDVLADLSEFALEAVIYTDIARDGMLEGPNLGALKDVLAVSRFPVIASGGITRLEDIQAIKSLGAGVAGAIVGKALYDGRLDLAAALKAAA